MSFDHHQLIITFRFHNAKLNSLSHTNDRWNEIFTCSCQDATKIVNARTHKRTEPENKDKKSTHEFYKYSFTERSHASPIDANLNEPNSTLIKWKFAWRNKTQTHTYTQTQTKIKNLCANENFTAAFNALRIFRRVYSQFFSLADVKYFLCIILFCFLLIH